MFKSKCFEILFWNYSAANESLLDLQLLSLAGFLSRSFFLIFPPTIIIDLQAKKSDDFWGFVRSFVRLLSFRYSFLFRLKVFPDESFIRTPFLERLSIKKSPNNRPRKFVECQISTAYLSNTTIFREKYNICLITNVKSPLYKVRFFI